MKKLLLVLVVLFPVLMFAQEGRKLLRGKVVADSLKVEYITVLNKNTNIKAITNDNGLFTIYAQPADTLYFSSLTFRPAMLILVDNHFTDERLTIKLDLDVTMLDEVIITTLTGNLEEDSKGIKTRIYTSDLEAKKLMQGVDVEDKIPVNPAFPSAERRLPGMDFVKIYDMIFKPKGRKKDYTKEYLNGKTFTEVAQEKYTYYFFTETLKLKHEEIGLFLAYCDNGEESAKLLAPDKEFELTDYLIKKGEEYHKIEK